MYKLIRTLLPVLAAMIATPVSAQSVSWKSSVQHLDGQTYRIVLEASIPAPWHMYDMGPYEGGPNATTITFTPGEGAVLEGGVEQLTRPERHYDKTFGMEIGTFARKAQFAQSVKLTAPQATVKAELAWMICNARRQGFSFSAGLRPGVDVLTVFTSPVYCATVLFLVAYAAIFVH